MKSITVRDHMQNRMPLIRCGMHIADVVDTLLEHRLTGAPVVNNNNEVIGFISEHDCLKQLLVSSYHSEGMPRVDELMHDKPLTVSPEDSLVDLARCMETNKPKVYPVVENGKLIGVISRSDVLRALCDERRIRRRGVA